MSAARPGGVRTAPAGGACRTHALGSDVSGRAASTSRLPGRMRLAAALGKAAA